MSKILLCTPFFPPNIGGAETFAQDLFNEVRKTHRIDVLTFMPFDKTVDSEVYIPTGDTIHRMSWSIKQDKVWQGTTLKHIISVVPKMLRWAIWMYKGSRYDTVQSMGVLSAIVGNYLKWRYGVKHYACTLALYDCKNRSFLFRWAIRTILDYADKIFVEGETGERDLLDAGVDWLQIIKFQHWIDQTKFTPSKKKKSKHTRILFVGRPHPGKGHEIAKAVAKIKGVDMTIVERIDYDQLPPFYQNTDILIVPSTYSEGFARVVAEGASCGCCVVTSNVGSLPEMVEDFGVIVPPSKKEFIKIIKWLMHYPKTMKWHSELSLKYRDRFNVKNAGVFLNEL